MKFKKVAARKKAASPMDTMEDEFNDDECSNDEKGHSPVRNTANARERARMRVLSSAFYRLKTIIPWVPHDTKLSKLDTLRLARNYIAYLTSTLDGEPVEEITNKMPHPQKMTWPYIFHQPDAPKKVSITQLKDDLHYVKDDYSKEITTLNDISHKYSSPYDSFNRCNDYEMIYD